MSFHEREVPPRQDHPRQIASLGIAWELGAIAGNLNLGTPGWIAAGVLALWATSKMVDFAVRKPSNRPARRKTS